MTHPNEDVIRFRLQRARETLDEARIMAQTEHWNGCVNRLYYACFYAVNAILLTKGLSSSKHSGVRSFFSLHFVKTGIFPKELAELYNALFDCRQESDYEDFFTADPDEATSWVQQAALFIDTVAGLIKKEQ